MTVPPSVEKYGSANEIEETVTTTRDEFETTKLPCLTDDTPPIAGAIKRRYEDFRVDEIPAYEPCGEGDHVYFKIEKRGLATMRAVNDIASQLGVPARQIGLAGLKDARAVATQTLSIEHIDPKRVERLDIPRIKILSVSRHRNKLKIGHLRGNAFDIRLRECDPTRIDDIRAICERLASRGVPNYFGRQRFGTRGDTWQVGKAVLANDAVTVVDLMLGRPGPFDTGAVLEARKLYEAGDFDKAAKTWPFGFRDNIRVCRQLARANGKHRRAYHAIDVRMKKFFLNAYQSYLFNLVLARRMPDIDRLVTGDLAWRHERGSVFKVEDVDAEAPRAAAFEISPTGPIFGVKMTRAEGQPGKTEQAILDAEKLRLEDFRGLKRMKLHGSRRPLRYQAEDLNIDAGADEFGPFVSLSFKLPAGCYATMILQEVCKDALEEGLDTERPND